jgi:hypothetical protein
VTASGYLDGRAVAETEGGPRQRPQLLGDVTLEASPSSAVTMRLETRGRIGGPFEGGSGPAVYNFDDTYQNQSPAIDFNEAWAEWRGRHAEVRLGIQKFVWGKLDGIPPTDVVSPRDFHDPLVDDFEERKIGVPAVQGTYYLPDLPRLNLSGLRMSLAYIPFAVPSRLALLEERWFPQSIIPASRFKTPLPMPIGTFTRANVAVDFETRNRTPPRQFDEGGLAFRLGGTWGESDWDLYHYTGPETGPDANIDTVLVVDVTKQTPPVLRGRADAGLVQDHDRIHMTGVDWAMPLAGFTLRAEAANLIDRPYLQVAQNLTSPAALRKLDFNKIGAKLIARGRAFLPLGDLFVDLDSVEWGIGADYLWNGWQPILQVNQTVFLDNHPTLLLNDPETRFSGTIRKRVLGERLEFELRVAYGIERDWWLAFPRVSYLVRDDLRLRLGYLAIGGPPTSVIGQFRANDEVVMQARYSF